MEGRLGFIHFLKSLSIIFFLLLFDFGRDVGLTLGRSPIYPRADTKTNKAFTLTFTPIANYVFGLQKETRALGGNPHRHILAPHRTIAPRLTWGQTKNLIAVR